MFGRDGLQDMLAAAYAGKCDAVIVEALDRLSRDMEDLAGIHKRLTFGGIKILAVHDGGEANTAMVGMKAVFAQMFREDGAKKVRRGMEGLLAAGKTAGGRAYGYAHDPANRGAPMIVREEAETVLRIFQEYHAGTSPKAICRALNDEGVSADAAQQIFEQRRKQPIRPGAQHLLGQMRGIVVRRDDLTDSRDAAVLQFVQQPRDPARPRLQPHGARQRRAERDGPAPEVHGDDAGGVHDQSSSPTVALTGTISPLIARLKVVRRKSEAPPTLFRADTTTARK